MKTVLVSLALVWVAIPALAEEPVEGANPVAFNIDSIKRGRQLYAIHCVTCHGVDGRGDTEMREFLKTAPSDLTDDTWTYGGHDAALFSVIQMGRADRDMPGFSDKLSDERIWQVINYMRYLAGKRP